MKKITLFLALLAITSAALAQTCPISYKRNNGFGRECSALITLVFPDSVSCKQTSFFTILHVYQNGVELAVSFKLRSIQCVGSQSILTYCGTGGNIPAGGLLTFSFQKLGGIIIPCIVPSGGPLPVKLSAFFAKRNNNAVALNWKTETEINAKEFILERKTGNDFVTVATIAASNNSSGSSYSFADNNTNKSITLYRLKMVDIDGAFSYSNISAVKGTSTVSNFTVFPNPSSGNAKVTISDISEATDVQLVDLSGRVLKNITITNSNSIELNSLQKGMYMIRIINKNSGESVTQKLSVVN